MDNTITLSGFFLLDPDSAQPQAADIRVTYTLYDSVANADVPYEILTQTEGNGWYAITIHQIANITISFTANGATEAFYVRIGKEDGTLTITGTSVESSFGFSQLSGSMLTFTLTEKEPQANPFHAPGIVGNQHPNLIFGDKDANFLNGGAGNDTIYGGAGDDRLDGDEGRNELHGGIGDDTYYIDNTGTSTVVEHENEGIDTVKTNVSYTLPEHVENLEASNFRSITGIGNALNNTMRDASFTNNHFMGMGGNDTLYGGMGTDTLDGGEGDDVLYGGRGNHTYIVDSLFDVVVDSSVDDIDTVYASAWSEAMILYTNVENLTLTGSADLPGTGNSLDNVLTGNSGNNILSGLEGNDTLSGMEGNDTLRGGTGFDHMYGGAGHDLIDGASGFKVVAYGGSGDDTVKGSKGSDRLFGDDGNDFLEGSVGKDTIAGGMGNDTLHGQGSHDRMDGNDGTDALFGGSGNDSIWGGAGDDTLWGGTGADVLHGGTGNDAIYGGRDADVLFGGAGNDVIEGNDGSDILWGMSGNDSLFGGKGNDILDGGDWSDTLDGGDGADVLFGGQSNDMLFGGAGDDSLTGGTGNDRLTGGFGADLFVFAANDGNNTILDFSRTEGDQIAFQAGSFAPGTTTEAILSAWTTVSDAGITITLENGGSVMILGVTDLIPTDLLLL